MSLILVKRSMVQLVYDNRGYITLMSVLILGAVGLAITLSLLLLGLDAGRTSLVVEKSAQAKAIVNSCIEAALQEIREDTPYTGTATLNFTYGSCTYTVTNTGGSNRHIEASGLVDTIVRKVEIDIDAINPDINIVSWQELADF